MLFLEFDYVRGVQKWREKQRDACTNIGNKGNDKILRDITDKTCQHLKFKDFPVTLKLRDQ